MLRLTPLATEICINPGCGGTCILGDQIANHQADGVFSPIFTSPKPIDALDDILPTEVRVVTSYPFAFDNRVGIVFLDAQEDLNEENRDISPAVRQEHGWLGTRLRTREDNHRFAPGENVQGFPHAVP
ncbi:MAG: hypothetical protein QOH06_3224 [Acidobacteriota bacterium]|jgi:hypothetical protein|nr:hypothetical protein [Acidobacteriota bacterium]